MSEPHEKELSASEKEFEAKIESRLEAKAREHGEAMYKRMQEPGFRERMDRAFDASPEELGAALVRHQWQEQAKQIETLKAEVARLTALLNTPEIKDFGKAVDLEAIHQRERWGTAHDAGKRPEDWIALVTYLLGKATKAHYDANHEKLLHHVITIAAACSNWHANASGTSTQMRPGVGVEFCMDCANDVVAGIDHSTCDPELRTRLKDR